MTLQKCPKCEGERYSTVYVNTGVDSSKHYSESMACVVCLGAGYVSHAVHADFLQARERGRVLRQERISKGLTLRQAADLEGVSVATISKREYGY